MRRALPHLLALTLGVSAALLAACGSTTSGGIPRGDASVIKGQLEDVRQRVNDGQCDGLASQLRDVDQAIDGLPRSVDARLVSSLRDGADKLQNTAISECNLNNSPTETTTTPTTTETTPTVTETTPTETVPTETVPTETVPTETTPTPDPTPTPVPTPTPDPTVPPPPPVNPGGGASPEIP